MPKKKLSKKNGAEKAAGSPTRREQAAARKAEVKAKKQRKRTDREKAASKGKSA